MSTKPDFMKFCTYLRLSNFLESPLMTLIPSFYHGCVLYIKLADGKSGTEGPKTND
jgi:hypothetical protein